MCPIRDNFWPNTKLNETTGCIEWQRGKGSFGYGSLIGANGKSIKAHRMAWELTKGKIPGGMEVLHSCDNPPCCNPEHLFLGTQKENLEDMTKKGRRNTSHNFKPQDGENNNRAKLKKPDIISIKAYLRDGKMSHREIAIIYGVSRSLITLINTERIWKGI